MKEVKADVRIPTKLVDWVRTADKDGIPLVFEAKVGRFLLRARSTGHEWDALVFADGLREDKFSAPVERVLVSSAINWSSPNVAKMSAERMLSWLVRPVLEAMFAAERERDELCEYLLGQNIDPSMHEGVRAIVRAYRERKAAEVSR